MSPELINQILIPIALSLILFTMGLTLTFADFRRLVEAPRAVLIGLLGQIVLMPAVGIAFLYAWPQNPTMAIGFMLLIACPGGPTSNFLTHLAKGDTALSVTLTAISSLLGAITVPIVVNIAIMLFADGATRDLPLLETVVRLFLTATLPVLVGLGVREFAPKVAARMEPIFQKLALAVFACVVIYAALAAWALLRDQIAGLIAPVMALNLLVVAMGWTLAWATRLGRPRQVALAMETGLQNAALAIFIAFNVLQDAALIAPAAIYSLWMNIAAFGLAWWLGRKAAEKATQPA